MNTPLVTVFWLFMAAFLFYPTGSVFCQFETGFIPYYSEDTTLVHKYALEMDARLKADIASITATDKNIKAGYKDIYQDQHDWLVSLLRDDYVLFDDKIAPMFAGILDEIMKANPELKRNVRLMTLKADEVNAFNTGENSVFVNLGLLSRMENESQIAFVLCHELAHHYQDHVNQAISKQVTTLYSKETQQQLKQAAKSEYKSYSKLKAVFEKCTFSFNRHSRDKESEADSLGLVYLKKTRFDATQVTRVLELLDSSDREKYSYPIDLRKTFQSDAYPFKDSWSFYEKSTMWHASYEDYENIDSLKDHPDCPVRIIATKRILSSWGYSSNGKSKFMKDQKTYTEMADRADFEIIETLYNDMQIDRALYLSLQMLNKYPQNIYLHAMVGKCMYRIYNAQQNRELGKIVALPDPRFEEPFDRLLTFIEQLRLTDISNLGYNYIKKYNSDDENYLHALYLCSKVSGNAEDMSRAKEKYKSLYPEGRFKKDFE